jgi:hypothetical protein
MSYTAQDYTEIMRRPQSGWTKFGSTPNFEKVINYQLKNQFTPSIASLNRAIKELGLRRVDGKTAADDQRELRAAAQASCDSVVDEVRRLPLTPEYFQEIGSLSQLDLSRMYFADDTDGLIFRIKYDRAVKEFGFRPAQRFASITAEKNDGQVFELTPSQYRAIPAQVTTRRYMLEPAFKRSVDGLVRRGLI